MNKGKIKLALSLFAATGLLIGSSLSAFASKAVVSDGTVRIRSEASTSGSVVASGAEGSSYEILETIQGTDGYTWYKVQTDAGQSGYVRGDLVKVEGDDGTTTTITTDTTANTASSLAPTDGTPINPVDATIAGTTAVNVRSGAGTGYAKVSSLPAGTAVKLVAEANDSSGKKWYQIKCESNGVEGYLRSDLITIAKGETITEATPETTEGNNAEGGEFTEGTEGIEGEVSETENVEETSNVEETPSVDTSSYDYEIVYTPDDTGVNQYYLYDHINNTRQKVSDLLEAITTLNNNYQKASSQLTLFKILTFVCGGLAVLFLVLTIVFMIRSRNNEYDYYEEDDDDDDDEDDDDDDDDDDEDDDDEDRKPSVRKAPEISASAGRPARRPAESQPQRSSRRKAQNFLADDDDFEFEFLNMDDKD